MREDINRVVDETCSKEVMYKYGTEYHDDFVRGVKDGYNHYWDIKQMQKEKTQKAVVKSILVKKSQPKSKNTVPHDAIWGLIRDSGETYNLDGVKDYIKQYPKIVNSQDNDGNTALHAAAEWGNTEIASYLISHGANVNIRNRISLTPLGAAEMKEQNFSGHQDIITLLKKNGAH